MAAFVRTHFTNNYRNLPPDARQWLTEARAGGSEDSRKSMQRILRQPDFIIEGTTDDNTAVLNAGAAQSYLVNLSGEGGVAFPVGYDRDIIVECWTRDETGPNYQKIMQTVRGSATAPAVTGGVRNLGPKVGGRCTFANSGTDIVAADAFGGFSVTLDETATGRFAAAIPKARRAILTSLELTVLGTGTLANLIHPGLNAITLATGVIEIGTRQMSDGANAVPADTNQLTVEFDVLPVESCELVPATTPTPDEILVGALGQASENVEWLAHVYVGELRPNAAAANSD
jgi:hypothetical protein